MTFRLYLISYDISCPRRWRRICKMMEKNGDRLQYSVFACRLPAAKCAALRTAVLQEMDMAKDRLMVVDLGLVDTAQQRLFIHGPSVTLGLPQSLIV